MTARHMDNCFNLAIWCGYTALQHQGDSGGSYTALGQVHTRLLAGSQTQFQILRKRLVVQAQEMTT